MGDARHLGSSGGGSVWFGGCVAVWGGLTVRAYTWSDIWNHDVQFGFVCGAFAMFAVMLVLYLVCELLAWLAVGRRQKLQQRVRQYGNAGGTTGQSWRRG